MSGDADGECLLDGNGRPPRGCDSSPYALPTRAFISRMPVDLGIGRRGSFSVGWLGWVEVPVFMAFASFSAPCRVIFRM